VARVSITPGPGDGWDGKVHRDVWSSGAVGLLRRVRDVGCIVVCKELSRLLVKDSHPQHLKVIT
jgi:hypothetical protein